MKRKVEELQKRLANVDFHEFLQRERRREERLARERARRGIEETDVLDYLMVRDRRHCHHNSYGTATRIIPPHTYMLTMVKSGTLHRIP